MSQIERPPNANSRSPGEDWLTAELSRWVPPLGPTLPLPKDAIGIPPKLPLKGEGQGALASTFMRLDDRPKYFGYAPYRDAALQADDFDRAGTAVFWNRTPLRPGN
jgi:hypothetical protein